MQTEFIAAPVRSSNGLSNDALMNRRWKARSIFDLVDRMEVKNKNLFTERTALLTRKIGQNLWINTQRLD